MNTKIKILFVLALCTAAPGPARAASPAYINYQGQLNGADGQPLPTGSYTLEFNIYDQASLGTKVWGPFLFDGAPGAGHGPLVPVANGRFNVIIGPQDTVPRSITDAFGGSNRFVEMKVNNGSPILPRQQFLSSPYAFKALSSDAAAVMAAPGQPPALIAVGTNASVVGSVSVGTTLSVASNATISGHMTVSGNATISGNVSGAAIFATNIFATNILGATVNGEKPPYVIEMGATNDTVNWHAVEVPGEIIESYLGDANGGTIRFLLRINSTDEVRTIDELIYIEQPDKSANLTAGLRGYCFETSGGVAGFTLNTGALQEMTPAPWSWIYMSNHPRRGRPGLPAGADGPAWTDADKYRVTFLTIPNIAATIIIYDR